MAGSYVQVGSGDHRVIALHGWFGSALGWGHLTDYLNTAQFTYVFPDLRGYGSRRDEPGELLDGRGRRRRRSSWPTASAGNGSAWSATR